MKLIKEETKGNNVPRSVWDNGDTIYKMFPASSQTPEGLDAMCNKVNSYLGFKLFYNWVLEKRTIKVTMQKLHQTEIPVKPETTLKMLEFFIDNNIKLFPQALTDMSYGNIMLFRDEWVLIDWDDVLQGHQQLPEYIAGELVKECCKYTSYWHRTNVIDTFINTFKNRAAGTVLEISASAWNDIKDITYAHKRDLQYLKFHKYYNLKAGDVVKILGKGNDESTS
mgnify:CR=1 FL=1